MKSLIHIIICFIFVFTSCGNGQSKKSHAGQRKIVVKKGEIVSNIFCNADHSESYAVFLPQDYDSARKWPVVVFFDSHGKGIYPVQFYKELATKYHIVFAGSNYIKNGMSMNDVFQSYTNLMTDLVQQVSVDSRRIYLVGFSGGARMASEIAVSTDKIAGVIACSAGMATQNVKTKPAFYYVSITGKTDMNYSEMLIIDNFLESIQAEHQLLVFGGKHEWPPVETMNEAVLFLEMKAMQKKEIPVNDSLIRNTWMYFTEKEKEISKRADKLTLMQFDLQAVNYLKGLTNTQSFSEKVNFLEHSPEIKKALDREDELQKRENDNKQIIMEAFTKQDMKWWINQVNTMRQKVKIVPEDESVMYTRLLGFASLVSFSYTNQSLKQGDLTAADHFLKIYELVDPDNPDCYYFLACYYVMNKQQDKALLSLKEAAEKGFTDIEKMQNEPAFKEIQNDSIFISIVKGTLKK